MFIIIETNNNCYRNQHNKRLQKYVVFYCVDFWTIISLDGKNRYILNLSDIINLINQRGVNSLTRIYLVRHGETVWNAESRAQGSINIGLSDIGKVQAKVLAERMRSYSIDHIYASDLDRAYETAAVLGEIFDLKVQKYNDLREMSFGEWEGLTHEEIQLQYSHHYRVWRNSPHTAVIPKGEKLIEVQNRGLKAIYNIANKHKNQNTVIFSHGTIIKAVLLGILDMDLSNFYKIKQDNVSINRIDFKPYGPVVVSMNDTAHLERLYRR